MNKANNIISNGISGEGKTGAAVHDVRQIPMTLNETRALTQHLMERVCDRANLNRAFKRVKSNKGAPGVDGLTVENLSAYLRQHKEELIQSLLNGTYQPALIRGVLIPKSDGGQRQLGIPNTVDRVVQQAIAQVIEPLFDPTFSESSYGFRLGRSAHQALKRAGEFVAAGYSVVVDIDVEKFFDRVNHDILMSRLTRRIGDRRLLAIIRRFLQAGMMQNGVCIERYEGTPQGGPLSPILSNILLDELDKELEKRGHRFCRYADDCNIYVQTRRAGMRVLASIKQFLWKRLRLKLNEAKSAIALVRERKFLGYTLRMDGKLKIAPETIERLKAKIRKWTKRNRGIALESIISKLNSYLQGWLSYFRLSASRRVFSDLDSWIRRRLRCYRLKQRKRSWPIATFLITLGVQVRNAWHVAKSSKGWWRLSHNPPIHQAMSNAWFEKQGLINLESMHAVLNT